MSGLNYHRTVYAYHGCDIAVRDRVLRGDTLNASENDYDWLGHGRYFWEYGPERALDWARQLQLRGKIDIPAVLGAHIQLGACFDLLDKAYTDLLADLYPQFLSFLNGVGKRLPRNDSLGTNDPDRLLRRLDCAAINWMVSEAERETASKFHTVRGVFQEGALVFPDSAIRRRSHIQIAVRDASCVLGYFLPSFDG